MTVLVRIPRETDPFADRRRWTADNCERMEATGLLEPGTYELLDGEVVDRLGQNMPHSYANARAFLALTLIFGADYTSFPVSVAVDDENRPEPDACILQRPCRDYLNSGNPRPADMRLVLEISDTTLWRDLNTKARLYAASGVPDYWVLDLNGRRLIVHRQPTAGGYADLQEYDETQEAAPLAAPTRPIRVADLLP